MTCKDCKYALAGAVTPELTRQYECHRYPPTQSVVVSPKGLQSMSFFPPTKEDTYCGEYAVRLDS